MLGRYDENGPIVIIEETGEEIVPYCIESRIRIYQRQVEGWFLCPARKLLEEMQDQASFAVLGICFAYLEGVQQYREGRPSERGESKEFFSRSFARVFDSCQLSSRHIDTLYSDGRCGLFHDGMTRSQVIYDLEQRQPFATRENGLQDLVIFHPGLLLKGVEDDFLRYIQQLKTVPTSTERDNFDTMFTVT